MLMLRTLVCVVALLGAATVRAQLSARIDTLMPTPNLYADSANDPFAGTPEPFRTPEVDVLYATDRGPLAESDEDSGTHYGRSRSASLAFGSCVVRMGRDLSWEQLVKASRTRERPEAIPLSIKGLKEIGRLPSTPYAQVAEDGRLVTDPKVVAHDTLTTRGLHREVQRRLGQTPRKEAFIFIHGVNYTFDETVFVAAEFWHFLGRAGVPIAYCWPAGGTYNYDRESGEFTIYHLKQFLRKLSTCPGLEKIHFITHSRGADVLLTALRELVIETRAAGEAPEKSRKIGEVVLAAADLDIEVVSQRVGAERVPEVLQRLTVYVSPTDRALGAAAQFFSSRRLGQIQSESITPEAQARLAMLNWIHIIRANVASGFVGHSYFRESPAVSSDLILLLRDGKPPGAETGRPLIEKAGHFWEINDAYMKTPGQDRDDGEARRAESAKRPERRVALDPPGPYHGSGAYY